MKKALIFIGLALTALVAQGADTTLVEYQGRLSPDSFIRDDNQRRVELGNRNCTVRSARRENGSLFFELSYEGATSANEIFTFTTSARFWRELTSPTYTVGRTLGLFDNASEFNTAGTALSRFTEGYTNIARGGLPPASVEEDRNRGHEQDSFSGIIRRSSTVFDGRPTIPGGETFTTYADRMQEQYLTDSSSRGLLGVVADQLVLTNYGRNLVSAYYANFFFAAGAARMPRLEPTHPRAVLRFPHRVDALVACENLQRRR